MKTKISITINVIFTILFSFSLLHAAPASYDWRNVGGVNYVSTVKDQGACGACWAFATTAALESQLMIRFGWSSMVANLSEQTLISCSGAGNCASGSKTAAASYIYNKGIPLETCFAYTATETSCSSACSGYLTNVWKGSTYVTRNSPTLAQIKEDIYTYGPIVADMRVYDDFFDHYTSGIYKYDGVHPFKIGHDVLVVGYNDAESYFICKNTRGAAWGESGFFRIAYNQTYSEGGTVAFATQTITFTGATRRIFYVDYVSGNDGNNGLTTSTPFQHCPGDNRATSKAAMITLAGGDRVIFKGGVQYIYTGAGGGGTSIIDIGWSGSGDDDSQRIIYDGDSGTYASRWASGTDKAIIDGQSIGHYLFYFTGARKYVTVNNFVIRNGLDYGTDSQGGHCVWNNTTGCDYINISNCNMSDGGIITTKAQSGSCVYNINGSYWKIHDNTITDCGSRGVSIAGGSYNKIYNNTFKGRNTWMASVSSEINNITDNEIYNNIFYDHYQGYPQYDDLHGNWIHLFVGDTGHHHTNTMKNLRIYNNTFYHSTPQTFTTYYSTGFLQFGYYTDQNNDGVYIYNNVFFNPDNRGITLAARNDTVGGSPLNGRVTNVYILNNTFYSNVANIDAFILCNSVGNPDHMSNINIRNNIIYGARWVLTAPLEEDLVGEDINYNNYYGTSAKPFRQYDCVSGVGDETWATWQGLGHDVNGYFQDPLFRNVTVGHNFDLRLSENSPGRNTGENLTNLCSNPNLAKLCYDKDGIPRSQGAAWDMGAYQFIAPPLPPSNLRIVK